MREHGHVDWDSGMWIEHTAFDPYAAAMFYALVIGGPLLAHFVPDGWPQAVALFGCWGMTLPLAALAVAVRGRKCRRRTGRRRWEP